jgi:serine/threonine protein kinase
VIEQSQTWTQRTRESAPGHPHGLGDRIANRYRLLGELGRGTFGTVYRVLDESAGVEAALKILPAFGTNPAVTPERFETEVRLNRAIRHPNVVALMDAGVTLRNEPYVVTERLHGESLGGLLKRRSSIAIAHALRIVREAARGLLAVHRHDLVHRDVKPDNLFLCDEIRHDVSVKVLDFGFATETKAEHDARVCGTLEYIAPEQALGEVVDCRADVYALGVVLFRILTGELPFDACARRRILSHQLLSTIPPPSWLRDGLTESVDRLVASAVRKHPSNRYASMAAFLNDVERALAGESVEGAPLSVEPDRFEARTEPGRLALLELSGSN